MLGLPTENIGDILETAKLIIDTRPDHIHCNYFICSPNLPLAKYPQISNSCREYHLKKLINFLDELTIHNPYEFTMDCYRIYKKPLSRKSIREIEELNNNNKYLVERGLLPEHLGMYFGGDLE